MIANQVVQLSCPGHMRLIRLFMGSMFDNRVQHWIDHVPGIYNPESDNLSRFKSDPFDSLFHIIRPIDKYTQPFFDRNPNFNKNFQFIQLDLFEHAQFCFKIARGDLI